MTLFVDKYFSPFNNNPFGLNDFHTTSFGEFRPGPNFSLFGQNLEEQEHLHPLEMKLRNGSLLTERGFYDHFDSIFHDRSRRYDLRAAASDSSGRSQHSTGKKKEYIIPIKIESSPKGENKASKKLGADSTSPNGSNVSTSKVTSGQVTEIPVQVVRECPSEENRSREKSRSPILTHSRPAAASTLLTPTTDDNRNSQKRDSSNDVVLDSDSFFTRQQTEPKLRPTKPEWDITVIEIDDEGNPSIGGSLRRKPLRHFQKTSSVSSQDSVSIKSSQRDRAENSKKLTSLKDNGICEIEDDGIDTQKETERQRSPCSHPGHISVTAPPTYPIYDYLKPKLREQGRQIDYIRGDGNCFFRAISKDVYGSENYHAECRQAVCDLIQAHPEVFRQYIDHSTVAAHVTDMRVLGTWATTCEIYAAATLMDREIYVLAPSPATSTQYHWLLFSPRPLSGSAVSPRSSGKGEGGRGGLPCYVTLCHTNANHYDRIMPMAGGCNCRLAPPSLNGVSITLDLTGCDQDSESSLSDCL